MSPNKCAFLLYSIALGGRCVTSFSASQIHPKRNHDGSILTVRSSLSQALVARMTPETALAEIDSLWQAFPYTAAAVVCGFKASAADWVAQSTEESDCVLVDTTDTEGENRIATSTFFPPDHKRNLAFLLYGVFYQGIAQEYIFNDLYPVWFGDGTEWTVVITKVLFNLLIQTTLLTLPCAYILRALVVGGDDQEQTFIQTAGQKYWTDIRQQGLLTKNFLLWGPMLCLTFTCIPEHWQVTFVASVSFFWIIILSSITAREPSPEES